MSDKTSDKITEFTLPLTTERQLREFTEYVWGIKIPNVIVCPTHCTPWEAFRDSYFAADSMSVWKSSRGFGGKSYLLAALGLTEAVTLKANVNILGGSGEQSKNVHEHMENFWRTDRAPVNLLEEQLKWETKLQWPPEKGALRGRRNWVRALKASQKSVRGPHPQRLRCVAEDTPIATPDGWVSIKNLVPGQDVLTLDDHGDIIRGIVSDVWSSGVKPTIKLHFSNGDSVEVTGEHPILTTEGYVNGANIKAGSLVYGLWEGNQSQEHGVRGASEGEESGVGEARVYSSVLPHREPSLLEARHPGVVRVVNITEGRTIETYDATVPITHNYVIGTVFVSNCDEIDEMDKAILNSSLGQTMEGETGIAPQTTLSSTHQYAFGTMSEVLARAKDKGWSVYTWCISGECDIMGVHRNITMQNVRRGDHIYAYESGRLIETIVTDHWSNGIRDTIILNINGQDLRCTPEHRVRTPSGWQFAGDLKPGDLVSTVQEAQARSLQGWPVQDVPLWKSVPRLREGDFATVSPLPIVCGEEEEQSPAFKGSKQNLPGVRRAKAGTIKAMQGVPQQVSDQEEHAQCGSAGPGSAKIVWRQDQARACSWEDVCSPGIILQGTNWLWSMGDRLLLAWQRIVRGNLWALLAYSARLARERRAQARRVQEAGFGLAGSVGRRASPVGVSVVRSVRRGEPVEVFDLTVECGESFIAEGVIVHNCFRESHARGTGWLTEKEIARKKREVPSNVWDTEYDLQEPNPENRAIDTDAVARMFRKDLGVYEGRVGQTIIHQEPVPGASYVTGADWGKKRHNTFIVTFRTDVYPWLLVAYGRYAKESWPKMVSKFTSRLRMYPGKSAHDATGLGGVVEDYLEDDTVPKAGAKREVQELLTKARLRTEGIIMRGERRQSMLNTYINYVELGKFVSPFIASMEKEHRLASYDDVFNSVRGHLPDSIAGASIASTQVSILLAPPASSIATPADEQYYYHKDGARPGITIPQGGPRWHRQTRLLNDPALQRYLRR